MPAVQSERPSAQEYWSSLEDAWREGRIEGEQVGEERGRRKAFDELTQAAEILTSHHTTSVQSATELLFQRARGVGMRCTKAFLRSNSPFDFEVIVTAPMDDILDRKVFDSAHKIASTIREETEAGAEELKFDFYFMGLDSSDDLKRSALLADGYTTSYEPPE